MSTIPANLLVQVTPNVLAAGGTSLNVIGLFLTENTRVPINPLGSVLSFPSLLSVQRYFGANSDEAIAAAIYFSGFNNSNVKPAALLFTQYPAAAVAAYLRGGPFGLTLAQMQALSGSLTVIVDGYSHVITSISLASYNSFSAAATGISAAFTDPTEASFTASIGAAFTGSVGSPNTKLVVTSVTGLISVGDTVTGTGIPANTTILSQDSGGTPGGAGTYNLSNANTASSASCTSASTVLDVTADTDHAIAVGQTVVGSGVTGSPVITAQLGGTAGGIGTYRISGAQQSVASEAMTAVATAPVVTYDSVAAAFVITSGVTGVASTSAFATGTLAAPLKLTSVTGAVLSQGAAATDPNTFMSAVQNLTTDWATFMTIFNPDVSGNANKQAFATWVNGTNDEFCYACWDPDASASVTVPATNSMGYFLSQGDLSGTELIYGFDINGNPVNTLAAFFCGTAASIDFTETNGRITFAFRGQTGIVPNVTDPVTAQNLIANGYNFYGVYATANQQFQEYQPGSISGPWDWADSYINQIWLNSEFQLALMIFMQQSKSVPYNQAGYSAIAAACDDVIQAGLNFGAFRAGVTLSDNQASQVNTAAGIRISDILQTQGWYLQIKDAAPEVRQVRGSPPMTFWYTDGESVQHINLASVNVQ